MNKIIPAYDLHNLRVLVTRPGVGGDTLCAAINSQHGQAIHFPTIAFLPPLDSLAFQEEVSKIDQQDWLVFISPQAVYASSSTIQKKWPEFPWQVKVAAVGAGTAQALQKVKLPVHVFPAENWSSEGLLDLPEFANIAGQKILLVRGEAGRPELAEGLTARDAIVSHLISYQRSLPQIDVSEYLTLVKGGAIDVIICASTEGMENLKELLKPTWQFLQFIPIVVVSQRMVDVARELGFKKILMAKNASQNAIMEILSLIY